jgi:hypothetical protein
MSFKWIQNTDGSTSLLNLITGVTVVSISAADVIALNATSVVMTREAIAAAGSAASDAAVLTKQCNAVTAADGTKGVALPAAATTTGPIFIVNTVTTAALKVYPVNGGNDNINALAEDAAFTMGPGKSAWFTPVSATQWWVDDASAIATTTTEANILDGVVATAVELNRTCDVSTRIVNCTTATLAVTEADHSGKTIVLDRAAGIAVTLPAAASGLKFRFIVKTTFTSAASIKSVAGADIMIGYAIMGNDSDNTIVRWPVVAGDTADTIDLLGTSNSTGGLAGQEIEIEGLAANLWFVKIVGDAAGTEATPFTNTVA